MGIPIFNSPNMGGKTNASALRGYLKDNLSQEGGKSPLMEGDSGRAKFRLYNEGGDYLLKLRAYDAEGNRHDVLNTFKLSESENGQLQFVAVEPDDSGEAKSFDNIAYEGKIDVIKKLNYNLSKAASQQASAERKAKLNQYSDNQQGNRLKNLDARGK